ncbi:aromatic amino acid lyase [Marivibrio halodurans]|uniref:Aromatic amino acid lyase n=1 Tax=Marivibrio halodurans TaxID=2039722 RepID=A0A8J7RW18_9PROT|nr:aromatic amino acid ammonia-lyase [Marivibrio halodurans]MBP5855737.1 aromatic amino acid lyase [Marivibrio halodurans]
MQDNISLDGTELTPGRLARIAMEDVPIAIDPEGRARLARARSVVDRAIDEGRPVYGLTRGLGDQIDRTIDRESLGDFSRRTIRGRAHGLGSPLPRAVVRAAMVARLNAALVGGAGMSEAAVDALAALINAGVTPVVPRIGSIGESDLCLMATLALVLIGDPEGRAEVAGVEMTAPEALTKAGLSPLTPLPKDGLALISANAIAVGEAALAAAGIDRALEAAFAGCALMLEAFRANPSPLDPACAAMRPQPGQAEAAMRLRGFLEGSRLLSDPEAPRRLQDPLSFRCAAPTLGAVLNAREGLAAALDAELNGAGDNPLVLADRDTVISTPNFHAPGLALACDHMAAAVATAGASMLARCQVMKEPSLTGLPRMLSPGDIGSAGIAPLMKLAQALMHRLHGAAQPAATMPSLAGGTIEDIMSFAPQSAEKLRDCAESFRLLVALELRIAMQALHLRPEARPGRALSLWIERLRPLCPPLEAEDRPLSNEIDAIASAIR